MPKITLPAPEDPWWGPEKSRDPETLPGWFEPYLDFLNTYSKVRGRLRISTSVELPAGFPGDSDGRTTWPWHIRISVRVRGSLFINQNEAGRGAWVLFRQVAFAEFWSRNPLWIIQWWLDPEPWNIRAGERAQELLDHWVWKRTGRQPREKPPLT